MMNNDNMTDPQEIAVRKHKGHILRYDDDSWGWSTDFGEDYGLVSQTHAWAAMLTAIKEYCEFTKGI